MSWALDISPAQIGYGPVSNLRLDWNHHCFKYTKKTDLSPPGSYKLLNAEEAGIMTQVSPGRFCKGGTFNDCFVVNVSVRFSINKPVRSCLIKGELKYKSFPHPFVQNN